MALYQRRMVIAEVEAYTLEDVVALAQLVVADPERPWSVTISGTAFTHERDDCYLFINEDGHQDSITRDRVIIRGLTGKFYTGPRDLFEFAYDRV